MRRKFVSKEQNIEEKLRSWLSKATKVAVAGIGNSLRKDDFVGVEIIRNLKEKVSQNVYLIECETVPESFIQPIIDFKPSHILVIDAGLLNAPPGFFKLVEPKDTVAISPISTHALPLQVFCGYLTKTTNAKVALLIIQPKETGFGEGLTVELEKTADLLTGLLLESLP